MSEGDKWARPAPSLMEWLDASDVQGRTWCFVDIALASGFSVACSDALYMHIVMHGRLVISTTNGQSVALNAGSAILVMPRRAHALRTAPEAVMSSVDYLREERMVSTPAAFRVGLGDGVAARVLSGRLRTTLPAALKRSDDTAFADVFSASSDGGAASLAMMKRFSEGAGASVLLTRFASVLVTEVLRDRFMLSRAEDGGAEDAIDLVLRKIAAEPAQNWSIARLARETGMGRSQFATKFPERCGMTPMAYVTQSRMELARRLLLDKSMSLHDVSAAVGYSSEAAFARRFAKHFGSRPGAVVSAEAPNDSAGSEVGAARLFETVLTGERACATVQHRVLRSGPPVRFAVLKTFGAPDTRAQ